MGFFLLKTLWNSLLVRGEMAAIGKLSVPLVPVYLYAKFKLVFA